MLMGGVCWGLTFLSSADNLKRGSFQAGASAQENRRQSNIFYRISFLSLQLGMLIRFVVLFWHCSATQAKMCLCSQAESHTQYMIVIGANLMAWHLLILLNLSFLEAHGGGLQLSFPCIKVIAMPSQWHRTFSALVCSVDCCDCMVPVTEFAQPHALSFQCHLSFPQSLLNRWLEFRKGRQCTEVQPVQMESCFCCLKEFFTSLILHH